MAPVKVDYTGLHSLSVASHRTTRFKYVAAAVVVFPGDAGDFCSNPSRARGDRLAPHDYVRNLHPFQRARQVRRFSRFDHRPSLGTSLSCPVRPPEFEWERVHLFPPLRCHASRPPAIQVAAPLQDAAERRGWRCAKPRCGLARLSHRARRLPLPLPLRRQR
jgi:hypothetical protein